MAFESGSGATHAYQLADILSSMEHTVCTKGCITSVQF